MSEIAIALNRFGLGGRGFEAPPTNGPRWLLRQFDWFDRSPSMLSDIASRREIVSRTSEFYRDVARRRRAANDSAEGETGNGLTFQRERRAFTRRLRRHYSDMVDKRVAMALTTPAPFVERLVHFWANHFAVSADTAQVAALAGLLEFEAIRPHIFGRFADMLGAVERHPAMLLYLNQARSVGPNSSHAIRRARRGRMPGLNENLAREILELHTLGVNGGYGQADVVEFARALTGWTISGPVRGGFGPRIAGGNAPGDFHFVDAIHEPGSRTVLGRRYNQGGEGQADAILRDLASHRSTARFLATKLARHFAGDEPPLALVGRLAEAFVEGDGDLARVYSVLVRSPEPWIAGTVKFRTPWEWIVASYRATGVERPPRRSSRMLEQLGQPVWRPGSPAGYDDRAVSWLSADALTRRVEYAERFAGSVSTGVQVRSLAAQLFPGQLSETTALAVGRAESEAQGLALLLVSPEFLRR